MVAEWFRVLSKLALLSEFIRSDHFTHSFDSSSFGGGIEETLVYDARGILTLPNFSTLPLHVRQRHYSPADINDLLSERS